MSSYVTRRAEHGTQWRYRVSYVEVGEKGNKGSTHIWAYNVAHVWEQFEEDPTAEDWVITRIERVKR